MKLIILLVVVIELALFFSRTTVERGIRWGVNPGFIQRGEFYFQKGTLRALEYIQSIDDGFYRIEGFERSPNAAVVQGCYGTSGYLGFCRPGIVDFHETMQLSRKSPRLASYRDGLDMRNRLHTLLSVKYYVTSNRDKIPPQYVYVKSFGDTHVFMNKYYLPLGFVYRAYIDRQTFNSLPVTVKDAVLIKSFVSDVSYSGLKRVDDPRIDKIQNIPLSESMTTTHNMRILAGSIPDAIEYVSMNNDPQIVVDLTHAMINDGLRVRIDMESTGNSLGQVFWRGDTFSEKKSKTFRIKPGRKEYVVMINERDISSIRLDVGNKRGEHFTIQSIVLSNISLSESKAGWDTFPADVEKQQESFKITNFQEDHINGNIALDSHGMVFFGIPYDKGWRIKVNGQRFEPRRINIAFMGIPVKKGFYRIELKYVPPYLYAYYKKPLITAFRNNNAK